MDNRTPQVDPAYTQFLVIPNERVLWGVDSATEALSLRQSVQATYNEQPQFWGRYLPNYPVTTEELQGLHHFGIPILPIYNGLPPDRANGNVQEGRHAARLAALAWQGLGIPVGTFIFLDVEQSWALSADLVQGWWEGLSSWGYRSGLYMNPVSGVNHLAAWREATKRGAVVTVWSNEPEFTDWRGKVLHDFYSFAVELGPDASSAGAHQYSIEEHDVDLDAMRETTWIHCWHPQWVVKKQGALKQHPNHTSDPIKAVAGHKLMLPVGQKVRVVAMAGLWYQVAVIGAPYNGWYLKENLGYA